MSLVFSDTSTKKGIVQEYERECGYNDGDVSGNTTLLKQFAVSVNLALDDFFAMALTASGTWQLDDSNQTDYPIIKTNIIQGQRDYSFTTDGSGNLILDIYRAMALRSATDTLYYDLESTDLQTPGEFSNAANESTTQGVPYAYDKTANAIILDTLPSYNATNGLKLYINREASYFSYTDTIKKPGVSGTLHKYFFLKPALDYARRNNLANLTEIEREVIKMEGIDGVGGTIRANFGRRAKDERKQITTKSISFR